MHNHVKKHFYLFTLGAALLAGSAQGQEVKAPYISVNVDGVLLDTWWAKPSDDGKTWAFETESLRVVIDNEVQAEIQNLSALFNPDPFISYGLAVTDLGTPSSFGFTFFTPIVPTASPGTATASFSGSVTDGGGGVVDVTALPPFSAAPTDGAPDEVQVFTVGLPLTNPGLDLGPTTLGIPLVGGSGVLGPFAGSSALPAGVWGGLQIDVSFKGSGSGDIYTFNGKGEIVQTAVPEAGSSLLMLLAGCGVLAPFRRLVGSRA